MTNNLNKVTLEKEMIPKNQSQFFEGSIHLIFAVVVAQGFFITSKIFIPIDNLGTYKGVIDAFALAFVYFFLSTAWYGFYKSCNEFPHLEKKISIARYGVGLLNTFVLYYMINLTSTQHGADYSGIFSLLPVFFILLVLIHSLKYNEYAYHKKVDKNEGASRKHLINVIIVTAFACGLFVIQLALYDFITPLVPQLKWENTPAWNPIFIISSIVITSWYRWHMFGHGKQIRHTSQHSKKIQHN